MFGILHPLACVLISIDRIHGVMRATFLGFFVPEFYKWFCSLGSLQEGHTAHEILLYIIIIQILLSATIELFVAFKKCK